MLLVGSFNPVMRKTEYGKDLKSNGLSKVSLTSKPDSVSFSANSTALSNYSEQIVKAQCSYLSKFYIRKAPDIMGENFAREVLTPINRFLSEHGVSIKHRNLFGIKIRTGKGVSDLGLVENAQTALLFDANGQQIHFVENLRENIDITRNRATLGLVNEVIDENLEIIPDVVNPLENVKIPEKLVDKIKKIGESIDAFQFDWFGVEGEPNSKIAGLEYALKEFMPE